MSPSLILIAGTPRLELEPTVLETVILPLNYIPMAESKGVEPSGITMAWFSRPVCRQDATFQSSIRIALTRRHELNLTIRSLAQASSLATRTAVLTQGLEPCTFSSSGRRSNHVS